MEGTLDLSFEVARKSIIDRIATNSFYRGERIKEVNGLQAARLQAGVDNEDILKDEIEIAAADVTAVITRCLGRCVLTLEEKDGGEENEWYTLKFSVLAASNFPTELTKSVENAIEVYLFDKALEAWMLVNMPDEVQALGQRCVADAEKLRQLLVERKTPVR